MYKLFESQAEPGVWNDSNVPVPGDASCQLSIGSRIVAVEAGTKPSVKFVAADSVMLLHNVRHI